MVIPVLLLEKPITMKVKALKYGILLWHLTTAASHGIFLSLFLYTRSFQSSCPFTRALLHSLRLSGWGVCLCVCLCVVEEGAQLGLIK